MDTWKFEPSGQARFDQFGWWKENEQDDVSSCLGMVIEAIVVAALVVVTILAVL